MEDVFNIENNIKDLREKIADACQKCGRNPSDVKLIAVSKTRTAKEVLSAVECNVLDFGENRPQELSSKFDEVADKLPKDKKDKICWHQIGQLQKNKVKYIIEKIKLIHSVDSLGLAQEIDKRAEKIGKVQDILIQVNISGEETKSGVAPNVAPILCKEISKLENVHVLGLMTISVKGYTYEENKELFGKLKKLSSDISKMNIKNVSMDELSMGMSGDYLAAIEAGATMIRVGSAIFGERDYGNIK